MKLATAYSTEKDVSIALEEAYAKLMETLEVSPGLVLAYFSETYDSQDFAGRLKDLASDAKTLGATSCQGVMTQSGFHSADGTGLALFGLSDPDGAYGVGIAPMENDPRAAAVRAMEMALDDSGRPGEVPELIWLTAAPGSEELVIDGIADVVGKDVPVVGGSAADNSESEAGNWKQIAGGASFDNAVLILTMYPSVPVSHAFHCGYTPTGYKGVATRVDGRHLLEIDGRPAMEVYDEWTGGKVSESLKNEDSEGVLLTTAYNPLGRKMGSIGDVPYFSISHPVQISDEKGLVLFAEIPEGEDVFLMSGNRKSLVSRASRVLESAIEVGGFSPGSVSGVLGVYCAGYMMTVGEEMDTVIESMNKTLAGKPFLSPFTFGEQGCFTNGLNSHGNLMVSMIVFGSGEE